MTRNGVLSNDDGPEEDAVRDTASTYPTDPHGCVLCPLCRVPGRPSFGDCEAGWRGLYVVWEHSVPLDAVADSPVMTGPEQAVTSSWRVECVGGHVLAVSEAEEHAEPFDSATLPALTEASDG